MSFELYPAIDLRDGKCVRLLQGDYDRQTTYDADPVELALEFEAAGAPWIHVVDLDGARSGSAENLPVIAAIAAAVGVPVQSGGGIRDAGAAMERYDVGVTRCVVGTAAVENPDLVEALASEGHRVAVGLDVKGDEIAVQGWEQASGYSIFEMLPRFENAGVEAMIVTQINNDGMGGGADINGLARVLSATSVPVLASGGVGALSDIADLVGLEVEGRGLVGVIVGKAIHDGVISVVEAVAVARGPA